jgi:hypothetical protein
MGAGRLDRKCSKVRYVTKADATAAIGLLRTRLGDYVPQSAYYCRKCRGFHLTSMTQAEYQARQA